jgi:thiol-disulfide isomerase/thioredoxin
VRLLLAGSLLLVHAACAGIVSDVRAAVAKHDLASASRQVAEFRRTHGTTPEAIEAVSWLARGALAEKQFGQAASYAGEARTLVLAQLKTRPLDADKHLPLALGNSIEVRAQILAREGRSEAVSFLQRELEAYRNTSIRARIQKNLNLLTLEGKPAPPLAVQNWIGTQPKPLQALRGHPVLLFFWAHWCPDCKGEVPKLVKIEEQFVPRGLVLIGPTQHYGYVAKGEEAPPEKETRYIAELRQTVYGALKAMTVPLNEENFKVYGASTIPTWVLIDRQGIVRLYHPDVIPYEELAAKIEAALAR